jgi:hypothetical protein
VIGCVARNRKSDGFVMFRFHIGMIMTSRNRGCCCSGGCSSKRGVQSGSGDVNEDIGILQINYLTGHACAAAVLTTAVCLPNNLEPKLCIC